VLRLSQRAAYNIMAGAMGVEEYKQINLHGLCSNFVRTTSYRSILHRHTLQRSRQETAIYLPIISYDQTKMPSNTNNEAIAAPPSCTSRIDDSPTQTTTTTTTPDSHALYPSITNKIAELRYHLSRSEVPLPSPLTLTGTVKPHGMHADILIGPSPPCVSQPSPDT